MKRSLSNLQHPARTACENCLSFSSDRERNFFGGIGSNIEANGAADQVEIAFAQQDAFLSSFMQQPLSSPLGPEQAEVS